MGWRFCDFRTRTGGRFRPVFYYICIKYSHHGRELSKVTTESPNTKTTDPRKGANKLIFGYRIVILAVILAAITVLYYIDRQQQCCWRWML